jgi:AmmeMemoRadiSam system protein A/AmmeMemoRadiSam system protein B
MFPGAAVANTDAYRTPLGLVPVAPRAKELALQSPFISERPCIMQRPQWAPQSSKPLPAPGQDTPDTWEHSGEVQVPFLQRVLKDFAIIPVVTGDVDPAQMAAVLDKFLNDKTLLVVSTDLSHYHPYDEARGLDTNTVSAMVNLDIDRMAAAGDACAKAPIMTVLHLAKQRGWKTKLLDYRNSGDTSGNKAGVVGYAAIAFYEPHPQTYNTSERKQMLELARRTLRTVVTGATVDDPKLTGKLAETKGCFVTLTIGGQLRGCIGHIIAQEPLYKAIIDNATSAALRDTRFTPVRPDEVDKIEVEVSVLTAPEPLAFTTPEDLLAKLRPHRDGVVLQVNGRGSTYLPQVWEQIPDKVVFLDSLSQKAGCPAGAWRQPGTQVLIYHVEAFKESEK